MSALVKRPGLWLAAVSAALCALAAALWSLAGRGLPDQQAAERWQQQVPFSQVSVFFSTDAGLDASGILAMRSQIDRTLAEADLTGPAWTDGYSAEHGCTASAGPNSRSALAVCTGGDFFTFHPLSMVSGWYYGQEELSDALVVLDEPLAWQLFGSSDVAGMAVQIDGWPCTVAGVAETPRQADESAAYGGDGRVFMSYSLAARLWQDMPVTCYEALLPEAVGGFALQTVTGAVTAPEEQRQTVRNTGRFAFGSSLAGLGQLPLRVQRTDRVCFPYWENAARAAQTRASLLAGLTAAAALWPCLYGGFWAVKGTVSGGRRLKKMLLHKRG